MLANVARLPYCVRAPRNRPTVETYPMIRTTFKGPTNSTGSRIVATHKRDSSKTYRATVSYDHSVDASWNHYAAAHKLASTLPFYDGNGTIFAVGHDADFYYFTVQPKVG
jgi:hypothetical protein